MSNKKSQDLEKTAQVGHGTAGGPPIQAIGAPAPTSTMKSKSSREEKMIMQLKRKMQDLKHHISKL